METKLKKTLWFTVIAMLCLVAITSFLTSGCGKTEKLSEYYIVNFAGEDVNIKPQSVTHCNYAPEPQKPEREGYGFSGWFTDNDTYANEWNFKTDIVTQDTTLYAKWKKNTSQDYPIKISFKEYSLSETSCQWKDFASNQVIIINSDEKLSDYIVCIDNDYSKIDFSKHSLLLARGVATNGIRYIDIEFLQESVNSYTMNVNIHTFMTMEAPPWLVSIVTPNIDNEATITLNVQQIND